MRIVVDVSPLSLPRTGIGNYVRGMVAGLSEVAAGRHELRVQYFQVDGWVELRLDIVRGVQRSTGSPGPH